MTCDSLNGAKMMSPRATLALIVLCASAVSADIRSSGVPGIRITNTLQAGSTFYVSSGTAVNFNVTNKLSVGGMVEIGSTTMTSGSVNPRLNICGYNATDNSAQCGYFKSVYYGTTGNNIVFGVDSSSANMRLMVANYSRHIGLNIAGAASSQFTFEGLQSYDSDYDGNFNIRGAAAAAQSDPTEEFRFWMNTRGGYIDTEKGNIHMTPFTGQLYVQASTLTVTGGNVVISTSGAGITFPDGTRQTTAASGSAQVTFNLSFNAEQAKLPGVSPCVISNSTNSFTSSLLCDAATNENVSYATVLEPYNGGDLNVDVLYSMVSAATNNVVVVSSVACITPGDSQDVDSSAFGTGASATDAVPGTAGHLGSATVASINDSCAEGDLLIVYLERQGASASDTAAGDIELRRVRVYE